MNNCSDGTCPYHDPDFPLHAVQKLSDNSEYYIRRGGRDSLFPGLHDKHFMMVVTGSKTEDEAFKKYIQLRGLPYHHNWDQGIFEGTGAYYLEYLTTINEERNRPPEFSYKDEFRRPRYNCLRGQPIDGLKNILYPNDVINNSIKILTGYQRGNTGDSKENFLKFPNISKRTKAYIMGWEVPKSLPMLPSQEEMESEVLKMQNDVPSELVNVITQKKGVMTQPEIPSHQQNTEFASESEQKSLDTSEESSEDQETLGEDGDKLVTKFARLSFSDGKSIVNNDLITPPATQTSFQEPEVSSDVAKE